MFSEHSVWLLFYGVYLYPCHGMTRIENIDRLSIGSLLAFQGKTAVSNVSIFVPFLFEL